MANIFLKRRSLYQFIYWCTRTLPEAYFRVEEANEALNNKLVLEENLSITQKRLDEAKKELFNYEIFLAELSDVEKEIIYSPKEPNDKLTGIKKEQFENIRLEVFKKWCIKFLPTNIIYVREIDKKKLGAELKRARLEKGFSAVEVTRYLGISIGALRNYENGSRTPGLSVFFALSEIYGVKLNNIF